MTRNFPDGTINSKLWQLDNLRITHSIVDFNKRNGILKAENDQDTVRLHFGLHGNYDFRYQQLNASYQLFGSHNNIMYSKGIGLEVFSKCPRVETFGVEFDKDYFINLAQQGNSTLRIFTDKIISHQNCIMAEGWRHNNFKIQQVISDMINCKLAEPLKNLFLLSKSIELLVLQADLYETAPQNQFIKRNSDRKRLLEAKELLYLNIKNPPNINQLAKTIGINEYKLKKGFKELFGTTIYGFIYKIRMNMALQLLLDTERTIQDIALETGFSSPQHFSNAFKNQFAFTPKYIRKNPEVAQKNNGLLGDLGQ